MTEDLRALLHRLAEAIHRPSDHPLDELAAAVDALEGAPAASDPAAPEAPAAEPIPEPDTPAVFPAAPAPFGTETDPEAPASG